MTRTRIDPSSDRRRAADVGQFKTGDVLTLAAEIVSRARSGPVVAGIVGEVEARLCAGHNIVAVIWINPHLAHRLVLRELTRLKKERRSEDICAKHSPVRTCVGRFKDPLTTH